MIEYFRHDSYASTDIKLVKLKQKFGGGAKEHFWDFLEYCSRKENGKLTLREFKDMMEIEGHNPEIFEYMIKERLIIKRSGYVFSERLLRFFGKISEISEKNREKAKKRWQGAEKFEEEVSKNGEEKTKFGEGHPSNAHYIDVSDNATAMQVHTNFNATAMQINKINKINKRKELNKESKDNFERNYDLTLLSFINEKRFIDYMKKLVNKKLEDKGISLGNFKLEIKLQAKHSYLYPRIKENAIDNWQGYFNTIADEIVSDIMNYNAKMNTMELYH